MSPFDGKKLRELRLAAGLTQEVLAKRIGISRETVSAIENNQQMSIDALQLGVLEKWWAICRSTATHDLRARFSAYLKARFSIN
jgi:HTH-type transcriptional regulator/antitoxin HipB